MMEALLEQILKVQRENKGRRAPHFTYASSAEVYPYSSNSTISPLTETQPIRTPSSLRGASKLIDEILAKMYHDMHDIYSVGLRFFSVYGPWGMPGSPLFEMAERAVTGDLPLRDPEWKTIKDYVYIDDAVDATMAAMQFRPAVEKPPAVLFNVASGQGTSLEDVANIMEGYFPRKEQTSDQEEPNREDSTTITVSFGSTKRAEQFLGYKPRVSLLDGIVQLLAWHYDRAFPYGGRQGNVTNEKSNFIANKGIVSCLPNDKECLKAAPVFPCASECSHEAQCTSSVYDEVVGWTQALTARCETVLYTVDLHENLISLPSAHVKIQTTSKSFLEGNCNLAFVSETSPLVQSLRRNSKYRAMSSFMGFSDRENGEWILIPLNVPSFSGNDDILKLLPKLSPGLFFGHNTKRAIYCDPDILLDSIPKLLREASMQPYSDEMEGATAMLIGKGKPKDYFAQGDDDDTNEPPRKQTLESTATVVQNTAYRMVRIAVSDKIFGDGFMALLDSRWMVHTLQSDDSRLFRCDVFGEVVQWEVDTDRSALEFVLGLHDMWSRVIAKQSGFKPWWIGESVVTVPETEEDNSKDEMEEEDKEDAGEGDAGNDGEGSGDDEDKKEYDEGGNEEEGNEVGDDDTDTDDHTSQKGDLETEDGHGGFGIQAESVAQQEVNTAGDKKRGASSEQDDDEVEPATESDAQSNLLERDFSAYDTWMGVLSASSVKYFVRIVPSSEVGVVSLDDNDKERV
jgi:nucleoside-diphosphate-sugar epimerase